MRIGMNHEGRCLEHTTCLCGHKRCVACPVEPAHVKQVIHMREGNHLGVGYATTRAGQTPDDEMQLGSSMKHRSSSCSVSRVC